LSTSRDTGFPAGKEAGLEAFQSDVNGGIIAGRLPEDYKSGRPIKR
jgi:hypothetical protein